MWSGQEYLKSYVLISNACLFYEFSILISFCIMFTPPNKLKYICNIISPILFSCTSYKVWGFDLMQCGDHYNYLHFVGNRIMCLLFSTISVQTWLSMGALLTWGCGILLVGLQKSPFSIYKSIFTESEFNTYVKQDRRTIIG